MRWASLHFRDSRRVAFDLWRFRTVDFQSTVRLRPSRCTLELTKYDIAEETVDTQSPQHQGVFLLQKAHEHNAATLKRLLPGIEFHLAIDTLAAIAAKSEDRLMNDQREKVRRDYEWAIRSAQLEGHAEGHEEGLEKGGLSGIVQTLQELLGEPIASLADLQEQSLATLDAQATQLRQQLVERS